VGACSTKFNPFSPLRVSRPPARYLVVRRPRLKHRLCPPSCPSHVFRRVSCDEDVEDRDRAQGRVQLQPAEAQPTLLAERPNPLASDVQLLSRQTALQLEMQADKVHRDRPYCLRGGHPRVLGAVGVDGQLVRAHVAEAVGFLLLELAVERPAAGRGSDVAVGRTIAAHPTHGFRCACASERALLARWYFAR
jgi:hypothetical protein